MKRATSDSRSLTRRQTITHHSTNKLQGGNNPPGRAEVPSRKRDETESPIFSHKKAPQSGAVLGLATSKLMRRCCHLPPPRYGSGNQKRSETRSHHHPWR